MSNPQAVAVIEALIESVDYARNAAREARQLYDIYAACVAAGPACSAKLFNAVAGECEMAQATEAENMYELNDALAAARAYVAAQ